MEKLVKEFFKTCNETLRCSMSISISQKGWRVYFISQKKKIEKNTLFEALKEANDYILQNRVPNEKYGVSEKESKPFKLKV